MFNDVSCERARTRELLCTCDPRAVGLKSIYPWENMSLNIFGKQLYQIAVNGGYTGTEQDFYNNFGLFLENKQIVIDEFINFPQTGDINKLYFDTTEKTLYSWDNEYLPINVNAISEDTLTELLNTKINRSGDTMTGTLVLANEPINEHDAATKSYVDNAIENVNKVQRTIVSELPTPEEANENTIYMIANNENQYQEYMLVDGIFAELGASTIDLSNYVTKPVVTAAGNLIVVTTNGELIDSGISADSIHDLNIATNSVLGGVYSSNDNNYVAVENDGRMKINNVSTNLLYTPNGDTLILNCGKAQ